MSNNSHHPPKAHVAYKRPPMHRRTTSTTKLSIVTGKRPGVTRALTSPRLASSLGRKRTTAEPEADADDDMATTFLQFCAFCEQQIIVPNHSILYCSEKCRRKDTGDSTDHSLPLSPRRSPPLAPQPSTALPLISPRAPSTLASLGSKPPVLHAAKADLDPTEWKPDIRRAPARQPPLARASSATDLAECPAEGPAACEPLRPRSSAALVFLAQFHRSPAALSFGRRGGFGGRGIARTAPECLPAGMGDVGGGSPSASESGPRTPREEGFGGRVAVRGASISSLKGLAVAAENTEDGLVAEGLWTGEEMGDACGRLRKLLAA